MEPRLNYFIIFFCCIIIIRCSGDKEAASPDDGLANNPPIINNQVFTVSEIIDNTAVIGEVIANDPDNDPLVFSIKTNSDNLFEISSLGILKLGNNQRLDFDKTSKHQIIIEVSDGLSNSEATIEINVEDSRPFITTWITTEPNEEIFIRTRESEFTYDYRISWGDGTTEIYNGDASHSYLTPGEYKISIKGVFPAIYFGNIIISQDKIHSIDQWGDIEWKTMESAFSNCENLTINATDAPNLESTSDLSFMFSQDSSLNGNLNNWDVSGIENMSGMFAGATSFNGVISNWDVSNVVNMSVMFRWAFSFNQNIGNWDVSNVTTMSSMFNEATSFNQDLDQWDISNIEGLNGLSGMFNGASSFDGEIVTWNVSNIENMSNLFMNATSFNQDISNWNVSKVIDMSETFFNATSFNQDLSNWNMSNVTSARRMFANASSFNQDITGWNVSNIWDMSSMFQNASSFNQNLRNWDTHKVVICSGFSEGSLLSPENVPEFPNCSN